MTNSEGRKLKRALKDGVTEIDGKSIKWRPAPGKQAVFCGSTADECGGTHQRADLRRGEMRDLVHRAGNGAAAETE